MTDAVHRSEGRSITFRHGAVPLCHQRMSYRSVFIEFCLSISFAWRQSKCSSSHSKSTQRNKHQLFVPHQVHLFYVLIVGGRPLEA